MKKLNLFKKKETKRKVVKAFTKDAMKETKKYFKRLERIVNRKNYLERIEATFQFTDDVTPEEVFNDIWKVFIRTMDLDYGFPVPRKVEAAVKSIMHDALTEKMMSTK